MRVILPSDVESGSENVKKIFGTDAKKRTTEFLSTFTLSNDEILEVYKLSIKEGYYDREKAFWIKLLESQKGPFNAEVVNTFISAILGSIDSHKMLIPLLMKSDKNIPERVRYRLLLKIQTNSPDEFDEFVNSGEVVKLGFDLNKKPWQKEFMLNILYKPFSDKRTKQLYNHFDTMTEDELFNFHMESKKTSLVNVNTRFLSWAKYPRTTAKIIMDLERTGYYAVAVVEITRLAKHPNCPPETKMKIFEKTGDISLLPEEVRNLFVFE